MAAFATTAEFVAYTGRSDIDLVRVQLLLDMASADIRSSCGWGISEEVDLVETLAGPWNRSPYLFLRSLRVTAVDSVVEDGQALASDDYQWAANGTLYRNTSLWPSESRTIVVTYSSGYPEGSIPMLVCKSVTLERAAAQLTNPAGALTSEALGAVSFTYASSSAFGDINEDSRLDPYRLNDGIA